MEECEHEYFEISISISIYIFNKNDILRNVSVMSNEIIIKETFVIFAYIRKTHIVETMQSIYPCLMREDEHNKDIGKHVIECSKDVGFTNRSMETHYEA